MINKKYDGVRFMKERNYPAIAAFVFLGVIFTLAMFTINLRFILPAR